MADPPDLLHVEIHGSFAKQYCGYDAKAGFSDEDSLRAHHESLPGSDSLSMGSKWMSSVCGSAPQPACLARLTGRRSPSRGKKPELLRKESSDESRAVSAAKCPQARASPRAVLSDAAATKLGQMSLRQGSDVCCGNTAHQGRTSPPSRKRPASSDLQGTDPAFDQSKVTGRSTVTKNSVLSKHRKPAEESMIYQLPQDQESMPVCLDTRQLQSVCKPTSAHPTLLSSSPKNIFSREKLQSPASCTDTSSSMSGNIRSMAFEQSRFGVPNNSRSFPQPDSKPISHDQLAAEIKGIYAALVMVEAKCIKLDNAHMTESVRCTDIAHEQWQALIALHRTLLYEHHDFLSASQHPSTNSSLRKLATKYSMPARMWKHGIHSFLEVLRRRLPESLDYMLQFIYMAYQMVALLYETILSFRDTWIECLGDLARYRMAIEEHDMRDREIWGGVARDWYSKTSNQNPEVGRLYHHLGILARPNAVQQVYFYCRSLTCVQPFDSAMESLSSLLSPLTGEESGQPVLPYVDETDSMFLYFHATMLRSRSSDEVVKSPLKLYAYYSQLDVQIRRQALKWKDHGVFIAVTNISACFGYGSSKNFLDKAYRKSYQTEDISKVDSKLDNPLNLLSETFAVVLSREKDFNVLPHVHTILAFLWSVYNLAVEETTIIGRVLNSVPWGKIVDFLNSFIKSEPIDERVAEAGRRGNFLRGMSKDSKPLPEDYLLRGLVWCQDYFVSGWFDERHDEESRLLELPSTNKVRIERVLRLSICLSQKGNFITFDHSRKQFSKLNH